MMVTALQRVKVECLAAETELGRSELELTAQVDRATAAVPVGLEPISGCLPEGLDWLDALVD